MSQCDTGRPSLFKFQVLHVRMFVCVSLRVVRYLVCPLVFLARNRCPSLQVLPLTASSVIAPIRSIRDGEVFRDSGPDVFLKMCLETIVLLKYPLTRFFFKWAFLSSEFEINVWMQSFAAFLPSHSRLQSCASFQGTIYTACSNAPLTGFSRCGTSKPPRAKSFACERLAGRASRWRKRRRGSLDSHVLCRHCQLFVNGRHQSVFMLSNDVCMSHGPPRRGPQASSSRTRALRRSCGTAAWYAAEFVT